MNFVEINQDEFNEKINDTNKVLIDCYAPWCGPCKMQSPIIEDLSNEISDVKFYKINVTRQSWNKYCISSMFNTMYDNRICQISRLFSTNPCKENRL